MWVGQGHWGHWGQSDGGRQQPSSYSIPRTCSYLWLELTREWAAICITEAWCSRLAPCRYWGQVPGEVEYLRLLPKLLNGWLDMHAMYWHCSLALVWLEEEIKQPHSLEKKPSKRLCASA
ncbi:hypothetical protein V8C86DRAFT_1813510 [Haematococcus lacustris]